MKWHRIGAGEYFAVTRFKWPGFDRTHEVLWRASLLGPAGWVLKIGEPTRSTRPEATIAVRQSYGDCKTLADAIAIDAGHEGI